MAAGSLLALLDDIASVLDDGLFGVLAGTLTAIIAKFIFSIFKPAKRPA